MNTRQQSDSNSEDYRPSAELIAAAERNKGAESFYDKERDLYYCIDEINTEQATGVHTSADIARSKQTQPVARYICQSSRKKIPLSERRSCTAIDL